jgi:formylglycine-generating enzyme required for sulfatase activity
VTLSPFYLDNHEVTVEAYRASGLPTVEPVRDEYSAEASYCTLRKSAELPVNCVTKKDASAFCAQRGGTLPSEAQFEFAATMKRGGAFPWGDEQARCGYGVLSRTAIETVGRSGCSRLDPKRFPPGPASVVREREAEEDRIALGGNDVFDLIGNLSEWVRDDHQERNAECWSPLRLRDPACGNGTAKVSSVRGGGYMGPDSARAAKFEINASSFSIGFRCAYPGQ